MSDDAATTGTEASSEDAAWRLRVGAARGERTPISLAGWLRITIRTLALVLLIIVMVPVHLIYRAIFYGSPFPMWFLRFAARICGAKVEVIGTHLKRDVFYVANHVSWMDILSLSGACGTAFVAKAELEEVPVIGWLADMNRTIYVKRENRMGVAEQINALQEALADNWAVTVFPEGTTTDGLSLLPFKSSMLSVLEPPPADVLVQPVLLDYGEVAEWIGWVGDEDGLNNAKRILARKGTFPLKITFLEPFSPADFRGRKTIAQESRNRIEAALVEAIGKPLRPFAHDVPPVRYSAEEARATQQAE